LVAVLVLLAHLIQVFKVAVVAVELLSLVRLEQLLLQPLMVELEQQLVLLLLQ